jgi:hypothetical protein
MTLILSGTNGLSDVDGDASTPAIRGSDSNTGIFFGTDIIGFSEGGTEAMRINADAQIVAAAGTASLPVITTTGDVNTGIFFPAADTIAFTTGGTTRGRWTTDGLCFNADTAAANALDDYEEGTYTPAWTNGGGTPTYDSGLTRGRYTKIGNTCVVWGTVASTALTQGATTVSVTLPFTVKDDQANFSSISVFPEAGFNPAGGAGNIYGIAIINSASFQLYTIASATGITYTGVPFNALNASGTSHLRFCVVFEVN